jgi:hypothetical protein
MRHMPSTLADSGAHFAANSTFVGLGESPSLP